MPRVGFTHFKCIDSGCQSPTNLVTAITKFLMPLTNRNVGSTIQ